MLKFVSGQKTSVVPLPPRPCFECYAPMLLISVIQTSFKDRSRVYQCKRCHRVEKVTTISRMAGWLDSHLHPPR